MTKRILYVSSEHDDFAANNLLPVATQGFEYLRVSNLLRANIKLNSKKYSGMILDGFSIPSSHDSNRKDTSDIKDLLETAKRLNITTLVLSDSKDLEARLDVPKLADKVLSYPISPFEYNRILKQLFNGSAPII
jgi:hypothetical protein